MSDRPSSESVESPNLTGLLAAAAAGDRSALEPVIEIVYARLHAMAARQVRDEARAETLNPTALVHEAYVRPPGSRRHS